MTRDGGEPLLAAEPLAKPLVGLVHGAFWWCTVAPDIALLCSAPPPHDSRLAGLGARVGDRGGVVEDESTFWKPFPPRVKAPAKGQYETKAFRTLVNCQNGDQLNPAQPYG